MGLICLRGIAATCIIGVNEWERQTPQPIRIDLEVEVDTLKAAAKDRLADTVDYQKLSQAAVKIAQDEQCQLAETLAQRLAEALAKEFKLTWCRVQVHKTRPVAGVAEVGVVAEHGQRGGTAAE